MADTQALDGGARPSDPTASLTLDFLEWLAPGPRPYAEVMDAWRTSCPRLTVWEDAIDGGYAVRRLTEDRTAVVEATAAGRRLLAQASRSGLG